MSYVKLNTTKELQKFLKIVASEAVKKSLNESNDEYVDSYEKSFNQDKKTYNLKEQDVEVSVVEEPEEVTKTEPKSDASKTFGASFDALIRAINKLRSGKSTKDSAVRDQAAIYYERLEVAEREVLVMFMKEMAEILTGETDGATAQDPEDDPLNITISKPKKATPEKTSKSAEQPEAKKQVDQSKDDAGEDIAPPIRVNEVQLDFELRRKIRELMTR